MKRPKMILFDYGQTLVNEQKFDGVKGTEAVLKYATKNKYHLSATQIQQKANEINMDLGRYDPERRHLFQIEVPNSMFTSYIYESLGIEIPLSTEKTNVVSNRINKLLPENDFEFILTSSNYMFRKPHPRIFELALEKADLQPDEVWYIGDQLECDVKGAQKVGIFPVWYIAYMDMDYVPQKNVLIVNAWEELEQLVRDVIGGNDDYGVAD